MVPTTWCPGIPGSSYPRGSSSPSTTCKSVRQIPQACTLIRTSPSVAVGLSIYRNYFLADEPCFCDLDEFAEYNQMYNELMTFWRELHPDIYYELSYESLIESSKEQLSQLLDVCGLQWQEQCLDPLQWKHPLPWKQPIPPKKLTILGDRRFE